MSPAPGEKAPVFRPIDRLPDQRRGWHVHRMIFAQAFE